MPIFPPKVIRYTCQVSLNQVSSSPTNYGGHGTYKTCRVAFTCHLRRHSCGRIDRRSTQTQVLLINFSQQKCIVLYQDFVYFDVFVAFCSSLTIRFKIHTKKQMLQSRKWEIEKMCHFCNTTPPKPCKILKHVLFPEVVLSLTCVYVLVGPGCMQN